MGRETGGLTEGVILPTTYLLRGRGGVHALASATTSAAVKFVGQEEKERSQPAKTPTPPYPVCIKVCVYVRACLPVCVCVFCVCV